MLEANSIKGIQIDQRNFAMDVMRGVAVLGILLMNIPGFSTHQFFLFWGDALAGELTTNGFIFKSSMLLFDGRMRGLFTLLFGAGIILFIENKKEASIGVADAYFKRMTWLMLFGIIDSYILLWRGDVLFEYALCGIFVYVLRNARVRYLLLISAICIGVYMYNDGKRYHEYRQNAFAYKAIESLIKEGKKISPEQQRQHDEYEEVLGNHIPFSDSAIKKISKEITDDYFLHRSDYLSIFKDHSKETYEYQSTIFYNIFSESFGTILLGMALYKLGFFNGRWRKRNYWLVAITGTIVGLALMAVFMKLLVKTQVELWDAYNWRTFSIVYIGQSGRILSTLGYAALLYLVSQMNIMKRFLGLFANVGRMALTNYIMQTVLSSLYFFGFGFGHYGEYQDKGLLVYVICIWMIQITYSNFYLRYFQMGPLEWLWKRLTYGKNG